MKPTVILFCLSALTGVLQAQPVTDREGALIRSDTLEKVIYLCFTGHDASEGFAHVLGVLEAHHLKGSFFLTGDFVRSHTELVKKINQLGHFVGAHSDRHLLYCDWTKRDSLLQSPEIIRKDMADNLQELERLDIHPRYFMPPYEWYNATTVRIAKELGQLTVNYTPGTRSNADYTTPEMPNYLSSEAILEAIEACEQTRTLNGFHLLIHPGTSPLRSDKLYFHLDELISDLEKKGYRFDRFR